MYKTLFPFTLLFLLISIKGYAQKGLWTDEGNYDISWYNETTTEFTLTNAAQLAGLAKLVNNGNGYLSGKNIKLNADIDLKDHYWCPIGSEYPGITGIVFDGQGHRISNMILKSYNVPEEGVSYPGLFGYVTDGNITRVIIDETCNLGTEQLYPAGGIAACLYSSKITDCINYASFTSTQCGGIVGMVDVNSTVSNCTNNGTIKGKKVGGIIYSNSGIVNNCTNTGTIIGQSSAGGIMDGNIGIVSFCQNKGNVSATDYCAGGIIAAGAGQVIHCTNDGNIRTETTLHDYAAGGIIGYGDADGFQKAESCINNGTITGHNAAGIIGYLRAVGWYVRKIEKCANTGRISGRACAGGIIASNGSALVVLGCTNSGAISATNTEEIQEGNYRYAPSATAGGIAGGGTVCINCGNTGTVSTLSRHVSPDYMVTSNTTCGGIAGGGTAINCYNWGNLSASCHASTGSGYYDASAELSIGGILGSGNAINCYNIGHLTHSAYCHSDAGNHKESLYKGVGGIIGGNMFDFEVVLKKCYYSNEGMECYPNKGTVGYTTQNEMYSPSFIMRLNEGREDYPYPNYQETFSSCSWITDSESGLPVLDVQTPTGIEQILTVETEKNETVPLFIQTVVSDYAYLNSAIETPLLIGIYTSTGVLIEKYVITTDYLDIKHYSEGIYIVTAEGKEIKRSGRIIVKH